MLHPKTLLSMKPWLDFVVILVPNSMHQKTPVKWGIKVFNMADSLNGYLLDTLAYNTSCWHTWGSPEFESLPQPGWVVMHLMRHYLNSNHHVCTDQYYTGIPLTQSLAPHNTSFTGTVMKNRFFQTWSEQNCSHSSRGVSDCWSQHGETKERIRPS